MKATLITTMLVSAALVIGTLAAHAASSDERVCRGTLRAITVDNLRVPQRATCVLRGTRVEGNITVGRRATQGRHALVNRNTVEGDIQFFSNLGRISITRNRVDGNLQCKSNRPRPTGGRNVVQGNKEDQCARL